MYVHECVKLCRHGLMNPRESSLAAALPCCEFPHSLVKRRQEISSNYQVGRWVGGEGTHSWSTELDVGNVDGQWMGGQVRNNGNVGERHGRWRRMSNHASSVIKSTLASLAS